METRLAANTEALWQPIRQWNDNQDFQISLAYKTEGGKIVIKIIEYIEDETKLENKERSETSVIELNSEGRWGKYKRVVHPKKGTIRADISLQLPEVEDRNPRQIELSDLKIIPVPQPTILLQRKKETPKTVNDYPKIIFSRINPTKYRIKVQHAEGPYTLAFLESFHPSWSLYWRGKTVEETPASPITSYFEGQVQEEGHKNSFINQFTFATWNKKPIAEERHFIINGYANAWLIKPEDVKGKENYELIVEFGPQKFVYIGLFINIITWIGCLSFFIYSKIKGKGIK